MTQHPMPSTPPPLPAGLQKPSTNSLAIASLVVSAVSLTAFCGLTSIVGAILGHMAMRQIRESGEEGASLARVGIIVGWVGVAVLLAVIALVVGLAVTESQTTP